MTSHYTFSCVTYFLSWDKGSVFTLIASKVVAVNNEMPLPSARTDLPSPLSDTFSISNSVAEFFNLFIYLE